MKKHDEANVPNTASGVNRRSFLASAASLGSLLIASRTLRAEERPDRTKPAESVIDFERSFCHCVPKPTSTWVRIQIECRCEVFDRARNLSDEYILGVRAQTGLHKDATVDPGYDFWVIFSKNYVYNKRVHASSYNNNPNEVPVEQYGPIAWRLHRTNATPLTSAVEFKKALQGWQRITAKTVFAVDDGSRGFSIEYPVKWADVNLKEDAFRVETGPVLLLDQNRARAGQKLNFEDFQWAYLDYHTFDQVRCFLERPTSILSTAAYGVGSSSSTPSANKALKEKDVEQIQKRLFTGWQPPISQDALAKLFQTNHYSAVNYLPGVTSLYAIDDVQEKSD